VRHSVNFDKQNPEQQYRRYCRNRDQVTRQLQAPGRFLAFLEIANGAYPYLFAEYTTFELMLQRIRLSQTRTTLMASLESLLETSIGLSDGCYIYCQHYR
jgi:hypothetical protein